jgi:two-component system, LytTR family, sensor kinase
MTALPPSRSGQIHLGGRGRLAVFGFWTAFGLIESTNAYVAQAQRGADTSYVAALINNMPWWWFWAALTPVVFAIARRVRRNGTSTPRVIATHAAAATALVAAHIAAAGTLFYFTSAASSQRTLGEQLLGITFSYLPSELLTYAAIVGAYLALEYGARAREGELRAARLASQASESRLSALRMELNPHFLFNALNGIAGLVRLRENETAVRMLAQLGDMLRHTLAGTGSAEVPLEEDLAVLDRYIELEQMRFRDRLTVVREIDDAAREALVPPLLLQPLVENALRHGVASAGAVRLTISARARNGMLELVVADRGAGVRAGAGSGGNGVGLANTRARLAELYGARGSVELRNGTHGGAEAIVRLPFHQRAGAAEPAGA